MPEEMDQIRVEGKVGEDLSPLLGGAVDMEMDIPPVEPTPNHPPENN